MKVEFVHSRFCTNTFPVWCLWHHGETTDSVETVEATGSRNPISLVPSYKMRRADREHQTDEALWQSSWNAQRAGRLLPEVVTRGCLKRGRMIPACQENSETSTCTK